MATLAVDLGGTKTLVALVEGAQVHARHLVPTDRTAGPEGWLSAAAEAAKRWEVGPGPVGLTVTGLVADGMWRALNPETLPLPVGGYPIARRATALFGRQAVICNDAQAAAWGEYVHGAGAGRDMVFVTVSTGVGAGIVLGGRLLRGRHGLAGHAGQMVALPDGPDCPFEDSASGRWIARHVGAVDARAVFAAPDTPPHAEAIAASAGRVARLCRNLQLLLAPEVIVIGGGVGLAQGYLARVRQALAGLDDLRRPRIEQAALGGDAGILGVAALASAASSGGIDD